MTRWAMIADLRRCVGCQTCTASCKHANATPPGVQWRRVIDVEVGEYPNVNRAFVPVGCQHCDDPPCMDVCPSTATRKRPDGIVTIDYDLCIGCAYCAVACPYQARYKSERPSFAFGEPTEGEAQRFDPARVARFNARSVERLVGDAGIVRNRLKIEAAINNARRFLDVQASFGSFSDYLWGFVDGRPVVNRWRAQQEVPASTALSDAISRDLKTRGFRFVGSTIIYAHLQATGLVNDHLLSCFRHPECG